MEVERSREARTGRAPRAPLLLLLLLVAATVTAGVGSVDASAGSVGGARTAAGAVEVGGGPGAQAVEGLRFGHHARWEVDPAGATVRARHELTLTNAAPDEPIAGGVRYTYFPEVRLPVPVGAAGIAANADDGRPLAARFEPSGSPFVALAVIDLVPDLRYGQTQVLTVRYELPAIGPRRASPARVNSAYVGFPLLMIGDPGATTVEVRVPSGFEVEVVGDPLVEQRDGDDVVLTATLEDPAGWSASVVVRDDAALLSTDVELGEHDVVVRAWPDDPGWAEFTVGVVRDGVPALEERIGLPWPATRTIEILETAAPYLYGYAGWYQPLEGVIEVGDELDRHVVLHELTHLWFNESLFLDRWVNEGLAEVFAAAVAVELGDPARAPEPIDLAAPGAMPLVAWTDPDLTQDVAAEREAFGYRASWAVMAEIEAEIGLPALAEVIGAAHRRESTYPGPGTEELRGNVRWTQLLDLLEDRAGSEVAPDLFGRYVLGDEGAAVEARRASRHRYAQLGQRSRSWALPLGVRLAMIDWRFDEADALMAEAGDVLQVREQAQPVLDRAGVDLDALRRGFEQARDLDDVLAEATQAAGAVRSLERALDASGRSRGLVERIGLLLSPPEDRVLEAAEALAAGDYDEATADADRAVALVEGAEEAGTARLGGAAAVIVVGAAVVVFRRRRRSPDAADAEPADESAWAPPELRGPGR